MLMLLCVLEICENWWWLSSPTSLQLFCQSFDRIRLQKYFKHLYELWTTKWNIYLRLIAFGWLCFLRLIFSFSPAALPTCENTGNLQALYLLSAEPHSGFPPMRVSLMRLPPCNLAYVLNFLDNKKNHYVGKYCPVVFTLVETLSKCPHFRFVAPPERVIHACVFLGGHIFLVNMSGNKF